MVSFLRKAEIEFETKKILSNYYPSISDLQPPVDLEKILDDAGIQVRSGDFGHSGVAGAFDRQKKEVYVAKSDSFYRQRFTIAHELGHFYLHEHKEREVYFRSSYKEAYSPQEAVEEEEANWFAASLLMPKEAFLSHWEWLGSAEALARVFNVSIASATFRLKNLGVKTNIYV